MPKRFAATEGAIEKGLEKATPASAVKLIEGWEAELENAEFSGAKGLHGDLERLRKELQKDAPKGETVTKLIGKLGAATVKSADKIDNEKMADQVRSLGEALNGFGTPDDGSDD